MDAQVMCGKSLKAGAVTCVRNIRNPIVFARAVMQQGKHVLLSCRGAEDEARTLGLAFEEDSYFFTQFRFEQLEKARKKSTVVLDHSASNHEKFGTVGAVALDTHGNLAASTSTGGMTNQKPGRVGDTPLVGCGNYASNKTCAVSCTGIGESFIRIVAAHDVSALMEYKNISLEKACRKVIEEKLPEVGGEGGLIAVDKMGNITLPFISEGMYRSWYKAGEEIQLKIYRD
jgi:L-asparaginase / beta-aspartyl-peptidase